ncbi:hypothetical protein HNR44_002653 [Geomicrobium halophilum]|uniref:Uncharacterized protein n=1 Tax=Geomicrobium halophilum TaxID=549000 RepID=A0A841PZW0_9BACL|nr:hypothetical protein [Geomicrobium halophilum]
MTVFEALLLCATVSTLVYFIGRDKDSGTK